MNIVQTDFKDLLIINHEIYYDERGSFKEVFRKNVIEESLGLLSILNNCPLILPTTLSEKNNLKSLRKKIEEYIYLISLFLGILKVLCRFFKLGK